MIRPFTCLCMLVAAGSGLYLYQEKHHAEMLDRQIGKIVQATDAARERTGMLRAEWTLLNEPDRLGDLATKYLAQLQPMAPTQFVQLADLDSHLPAIVLTPPPAPAAPATPTIPAAPTIPAIASARPTPGAGSTLVATASAAPMPAQLPTMRSAVAQTGITQVALTQPAGAEIAASVAPDRRAANASEPGAMSAALRIASADAALSAAAPRATPARPPVEAHDIAAAKPAPRPVLRRKPAIETVAASGFATGPSAEPRPLPARQVMAPIVDAFATPHPMQVSRPAVMQRTGALAPVVSSGMAMGGVGMGGSVLGGGGMARPMLAPPVPITGGGG